MTSAWEIFRDEISRPFADSNVDEILICGSRSTVCESGGSRKVSASFFQDADVMLDWLLDFSFHVGRRLDQNYPANGGYLAEQGLRWHAVIPPMSAVGPVFSLRRHRFSSLSLGDFDCSRELELVITSHVVSKKSLLIAGATGSGKTTYLASLLQRCCPEERLIYVESLDELEPANQFSVKLQTNPPDSDGDGELTCAALLPEILRLRPDRIILGEVRATEMDFCIHASLTGHGGIMTTVHARNARDLQLRFPQLTDDVVAREWGVVFLERGYPPKVREFLPSMMGHRLGDIDKGPSC